ncbi:MAG: hybrid sensor histidine kinase/response regulator [Vulcanimicrobiota bacterium]
MKTPWEQPGTGDKAEDFLQAQLARNRFLDVMSHELRTPLTAILGLSEALETGLYGDCSQEQREALRTINHCGHTLLRLINDILDITKLETGKIEIFPQPLSSQQVCRSVLGLHAKDARDKGVLLKWEDAGPELDFTGDRKRIKQALFHLLDNAVKFSGKGDTVTLKVGREEQRVRFDILDEGPGIAAEQLPVLLASFTQSDQSLSRLYKGAGLGLSLAKKLVDLMGGELDARNRPTGGACFSISMPEVSISAEEDRSFAHLQGEGTIVLVDDHQHTVNLLSDALTRWGFQVEIFNDARSLQARDRTAPVTALLMDGKLPDASGLDCVRWLREQPEYKDLPIVFLTASEGQDMERASLAAGASAYLGKPVKLAAIAHCLDYLLPD